MKIKTYSKKSSDVLVVIATIISFLFTCTSSTGQEVSVHLTKGDQTVLLEEQTPTSFNNGEIPNATINVEEQETFQTIDGFGFMMTQGSAQVLNDLNPNLQNSILQETFNPNNDGSKLSVMRISIGASDLSNSVYFYNNTPGDINMNNFSLDGPDKEDLIPIIKKVLEINPNIKILATPWSAPTWMKTNRDTSSNPAIGGSLDPQFYEAYARYFVRYLQEMEAEGIPIWGITPQNEPENPFNEPSMAMTSNEQLDFINNHLGPQIEAAGFTPRIIAFDHNCDNPGYPINILNNSTYAEGAAFHLYDPGANIEAMSEVRNATGKNVYFTEQFTSSNGEFNGDFGWHIENVVIGSLRNWSRTVIEWNYAADPDSNPRTPGGCDECLGAITVNNSNSITRNVSYYIISQISKFVQPGAVRLATNDPDNDTVTNVALRNENGEKVLLVYNINSTDQEISVNWNGRSFTYNLPGRSAATFTWEGEFTPQPPEAPTNIIFTTDDTEVNLSWDDANRATTYAVRRATNINGPFSTIASDLTNTTYTDTNVTNGTTYYYRIRAINEIGTTESTQISAVPNIIIINAFSQIEAEEFNEGQTVQLENTSDIGEGQNVGFIDSNDFLVYENVDFGNGASSVNVRIASGANFEGTMELRLGSTTGNLIGVVSFGNTGGYQSWVTKEANIQETSGLSDLYLVFQGGEGIGNINWFRFSQQDLGNPPSAPTNLTANAEDEAVSLSWNTVADADTYEVRRSTNGNNGFSTIANALTETTYTDNSVTNGTQYFYRVRAINQAGNSGNSNTANATPQEPARSAFVRIEAEDFDNSQGIQTQNTSDAGGGQNVGFINRDDFLVYNNIDFGNGARSLEARIASNANFTGTMQIRLGSVTGDLVGTLSFGFTGGWQSWITRTVNIDQVTGIHDLYFVFLAPNSQGIGNINWFVFNESNELNPPATPNNLTATGGDATVSLSWNSVTDAATYELRRSTTSNSGFSVIANGIEETTFVDNAVVNGTQYFYRVRAINQAGNSGNSNTANATPQANNPNDGDIQSGEIYIIRNRRSNRVMDVAGVSQSNGARVQQWEVTGGDNQSWILENTGGNEYKITALHSNKVLDLVDGSLQNGAEVQQYDSFDNVNQRWQIIPIGNSFFEIVSARSGKALEIPNGTNSLGLSVVQQERNNSPQQQWSFELLSIRSSTNENIENTILQNIPTKNVVVYTNQFSENTVRYELEINEKVQAVEIFIFNTLGQVVAKFTDHPESRNGIQNIPLDSMTKDLPKGQYFIKVDNLQAKPFIVY
ncbi:carbohydrate-binding protein [uncultured Dokdonia sp.]|uniref:carbohydrate-binding protein n=1 Tax=uncultured Dokdonia sp. TaxID=575653 RepID=UPI0026144ED8|nr:carbohydrate-binding protein [uncultured Dokdonia sp.]